MPAVDRVAVSCVTRLEDYTPPDWLIDHVALDFALDPERTLVRSRLHARRNGRHDRPLILDGEELELVALSVDGHARTPDPRPCPRLLVAIDGDEAVVETLVAIRPAANSRLMGLYASGGTLCTQCEAEGFRRISFFPDRPDVMARWDVRLEADLDRFPLLLSNGNPAGAGVLEGGRHWAAFHDPHPKPAYLFALVAADLAALRDHFTTASGRDVELYVWAEEADLPRCRHALDSLKAAMAWDEANYGREYDLDCYHIVAVHDFNFGAMENKGLNIFNARYVLADSRTATDHDLDSVAAVVAHEYFHNWSGNRVTLRDWFQLALKEGFTVFRDQQFSADIGSPLVRRIEELRALRATQFPEDDGPLAHAVRPASYQQISNFYTATVYDKGAEIIRMMARRLGPARFRRATDAFFAANDGRAATIEDLLDALAGQGLEAGLFARWYDQPGTPRLSARLARSRDGAPMLVVAQHNPRAGPDAPPLPIPCPVALFAPNGTLLYCEDTLLLTERETCVPLPDRDFEGAVVSLNRGMAAPVLLDPPPDPQALALLATHEPDPLARHEAFHHLALGVMAADAQRAGDGGPGRAHGRAPGVEAVSHAVGRLLDDAGAEPALVAEGLALPSEAMVADRMTLADPEAAHQARGRLLSALVAAHRPRMRALWNDLAPEANAGGSRGKAVRRLRGVLIGLLTHGDDPEGIADAFGQFVGAATMTERMSALVALSHGDSPERAEALARFHEAYAAMPEVLDKWFHVQAASRRPDTRAVVERLATHPRFDPRNPNRLRALILGFAMNQPRFHDREGAGYALLARHVLEADARNPQSAARLVQPLTRWRRFAQPWGGLMKAELGRILARPGLSRDLDEVVRTALA